MLKMLTLPISSDVLLATISVSRINPEVLQQLQQELMNHPKQLSAPNLYALKKSLHTIFPELNDIYIQYIPKLQLMIALQRSDHSLL